MLYVNPLEVAGQARSGRALHGAGREQVALEEFERYFLYTLLTEMRKNESTGLLAQRSPAADVYQDMLNDHLAGVMAKSGQLGIAESIREQLRVQEAAAVLPRATGTGIALGRSSRGLPLSGHTEGILLRSEQAGIALRTDDSRVSGNMPINDAGGAPPAGVTP
jgi:hypothetical protein